MCWSILSNGFKILILIYIKYSHGCTGISNVVQKASKEVCTFSHAYVYPVSD